jgi:hypothetical protein
MNAPHCFVNPVVGWLCLLLLLLPAVDLHADQWVVGNFSKSNPDNDLPEQWEPLIFAGVDRHTHYTLVQDNGRTVVRAHSQNAASGLVRYLRADPTGFARIQWDWKIERVIAGGDVTRKGGDDCAARVYVAFAFEPDKAGWWQRLRNRSARIVTGREVPGTALSYIWATRAPRETIVPNPFAPETMMIVLRSGNAAAGRWVTEQRNLLQDYERAFGRTPPEIIGIGLMTDTDNTGAEATAYYGDIRLISTR